MNPNVVWRDDRSIANRSFVARDDKWPRDEARHDRFLKLVVDRVAAPLPITKSPADRWLEYIKLARDRGGCTSEVAQMATSLWTRLNGVVTAICPPDAEVTEDKTLLMSWIRGPHHLEIEIMPSGRYVWFYRNHDTNDDVIGEDSSAELDAALVARARAIFG
jgi:hypothetical protein